LSEEFKIKFLFIYPPSRRLKLSPKKSIKDFARAPPLGILYLGKILEKNGYDVEVLDLNGRNIPGEQLKGYVGSADAVGMTLYSGESLDISTEICKKIKDYDSDIPLIIGGPHCCYYPEKAIYSHSADICVIREGENIIKPVMEALRGKRKLSSIPGIYYRTKSGIKNTKPADQIHDLDSIPFPSRHLVKDYDYGYISGIKFSKGKTTSILTSRGCAYSCRFCGLHYVAPGYRRRSIDNITEEIDEIISQGYETLMFVDDNFLQHKKEVIKIMDYIIETDSNLRLWIENARVDSVDRELYKKLRDAGVDTIFYGIESGNQDILDYYNKKITISQIKKAVKLSKEMGFIVSGSFIFGAPIETEKHLNNTRIFAKKLPLDSALFFSFNYMLGSPIWEEAVIEGKIKPDEFAVDADASKGLGNFTHEELSNYVSYAYRSFYFNVKLWIRELKRAITKRDFRLIKLGINFLTP
jgi:anaerobic magnesium-protoporphyrin IX monomethyl ester cyclase